MATVTAYTAERMKEIEDNYIKDAKVEFGKLILVKNNDTEINTGVLFASQPGLYLTGNNGDYVSTPDHNDLDITGDIDIVWAGAYSDWAASVNRAFVSKYEGNQRSYMFGTIPGENALRFFATPDGSTTVTVGVPLPEVNPWEVLFLRVTYQVSNRRVQFFRSFDQGETWTQLGTNQTLSGSGPIHQGTANVEIGTWGNGNQYRAEAIHIYAAIRDGIEGSIVAEFDATEFVNPYVDVTGKSWTIHGSGSKFVENSEVGQSFAKPAGASLIGTKSGLTVENRLVWRGSGPPEGNITAPVGTEYVDTAATNGAVKWVKASGTGNTGWRVTFGDTGRRRIASGFRSGWSGHFDIRRVGAVVSIGSRDLSYTAVSGDERPIYDLPAGFRSQSEVTFAGRASDGAPALLRVLNYGTYALYASSPPPVGESNWRLMVAYLTGDPWPTSLPGTPVA